MQSLRLQNGAGSRLQEWLLVEAQPGAGSFVMATGIVAVGISSAATV